MVSPGYPAIYDLGLSPCSLANVLAWNIRTAIQAAELDLQNVDIHICSERRPRSGDPNDLSRCEDDLPLYFFELFRAFQTHPALGHIRVYSDPESLFEELSRQGHDISSVEESIERHRRARECDTPESGIEKTGSGLSSACRKAAKWFEEHGRIPQLQAPPGFAKDVDFLVRGILGGKRPVAIDLGLPGLSASIKTDRAANADFRDWQGFFSEAAISYPNVHFVLLGRLEEGLLATLDLPNASNLRALGMNLGHELALLTRSDLFLGRAGRFGAMASFTGVPYTITGFGESAREAFGVPIGTTRFPFAGTGQNLVESGESTDLLLELLREGMALPTRQPEQRRLEATDSTFPAEYGFVSQYEGLELDASSTHRYFLDDAQCDAEVVHLLQRNFDEIEELVEAKDWTQARTVLDRLENIFPRALSRSTRFRRLCARVDEAEERSECATEHLVWSAILDPKSVRDGFGITWKILGETRELEKGETETDRLQPQRGIRRFLWDLLLRLPTGKALLARQRNELAEVTRAHESRVAEIESRIRELGELTESQARGIEGARDQFPDLRNRTAGLEAEISELNSKTLSLERVLEFSTGSERIRDLSASLNRPDSLGPAWKSGQFSRLLQDLALPPTSDRVSAPLFHLLAERDLDRLIDHGYANFKRTIGETALEPPVQIDRSQLELLLESLPESTVEECREQAVSQPADPAIPANLQFEYRLRVLLLWQYALSRDTESILDEMEEPVEGNPIRITSKGRLISSDLAISSLEFRAMRESVDIGQVKTILQIGGGYRRIGYFLMTALPGVRYMIVDVPPNLYITQRYLSEQFPDLTTVDCRGFEKPGDFAREFESAQLGFLLPHQLPHLPPKSVELALSISPFSEMPTGFFLEEIDRTTEGWFYLKQRKKPKEPFVFPSAGESDPDHAFPDKWERAFWRDCTVEPEFFESLHRIR